MVETRENKKTLKSLAKGFKYAGEGIAYSFRTQRNMKIESVFGIVAIILCAALRCTLIEWAIVIVMIGAVLSAEVFNTSIEAAVDLACDEIDPKAKAAKDAAAGAVLILSIASLVIGIIIFVSAFIRILG